MRQLLILALVCCYSILDAQTVNPILSNAYADSVKATKDKQTISDGGYRLTNPGLFPFTGYKLKQGSATLERRFPNRISLSGYFASDFTLGWRSEDAATQTEYVQGGPVNGKTQWQGPETGQPFSFGPSRTKLAFDGSPYAYDGNGRLVAGSGINAYQNDLFSTTNGNKQTIYTKWGYQTRQTDLASIAIRAGRKTDPLALSEARTRLNFIDTKAEITLGKFKLSHRFAANGGIVQNGNQFGFLNTVYRNHLLTPISFDNAQGYGQATFPRSFSAGNLHPDYLLDILRRSTSYNDQQHALTGQLNSGKLRINLAPSSTRERSIDEFNQSRRTQNIKRDRIQIAAEIRNLGKFSIAMRGLIENSRVNYDYSFQQGYAYKRLSQDYSTGFSFETQKKYRLKLSAGNRAYLSSTTKDQFWTPSASASLTRVYGGSFLPFFSYSFARSYSEPDAAISNASIAFRKLSIDSIGKFLPVLEPSGFYDLRPANRNTHDLTIGTSYRRFSLSVSYSQTEVRDQVYAIMNGDDLKFANISDETHRTFSGVITHSLNHQKFKIQTNASLFIERQKVTRIASPVTIAGFREVYTGLIRGETPGVIMGTDYRRNERGQMIIGADGYPLIERQKVIGNPLPKFTMKLAETLTFGNFDFNLSLTWNYGGQFWDGTDAVLDYYGRSGRSASLRNQHSYVFPGVDGSGHENIKPVDLFNAAEPIGNSWFQRNGIGGVASDFIKRADQIRIGDAGLSYTLRKFMGKRTITLYTGVNNIVLWTRSGNRNLNQNFADADAFHRLQLFTLPNLTTLTTGFKIQL